MSSEKECEVLLEVKDLSVSFASDGGEVEALDRISFAIKKG
ncbi:MAG: peptide ABC transporter ATP-binding protein, partial [Flavobacteriia bacterium]|nr:peptide ABC transporter ATP-binding protein [Flavobacteriia bacterium]